MSETTLEYSFFFQVRVQLQNQTDETASYKIIENYSLYFGSQNIEQARFQPQKKFQVKNVYRYTMCIGFTLFCEQTKNF